MSRGGLQAFKVRRVERRRARRAEGCAPAVFQTLRGPVPVEIIDASLTGVRLACQETMLLPGHGRLVMPGRGIDILVQRRWMRGAVSGWAFLFDAVKSKRLVDILDTAGGITVSLVEA